jgi:hypothetical protein
MRRKLAWVIVLLVVAALAVPATATPRLDVGTIYGHILDSTTGMAFPVGGAEWLVVDIFDTATMTRTVKYIMDPTGLYQFVNLPAGTYKMRFRYWDADLNLIRYRWYGDRGNFGIATPIVLAEGGQVEINVSLKPMRGAELSGTLAERGTGSPLNTACYSIELFEASGISLGWLPYPDASGNWSVAKVPVGRWTALATVTTGVYDIDGDGTFETDCGTSPTHLDTWYKGASGWPLRRSNLVADAHTFPTANTFGVVAGVDVTGVNITLPSAPTCRGKVPTMYGTTLADTIDGTAARDVISGLAGADTINGRAGSDLMCGDGGNDAITGGAGLHDIAAGGPGTGDTCNAEIMFGCEFTP